jgi:hypothetical protein
MWRPDPRSRPAPAPGTEDPRTTSSDPREGLGHAPRSITGFTRMTQAPTPGPLSGDDELIERGLRSIRTYDAVRSLRDALTATTARLTGYDWNADPDAITKQQGDAFSAADRVFSDLDAAVAAHPDIDLPECDACNGTGKIEEPARMEGANQHSACVRSCDECDGCGFAPDESLAPTAPVEASGSERDHRFVPGVMRCAKCNFVVVRRVFSAIDGTVGDGDNKTEPCPNGCGPLWPMTWEQNSRDMEERCEAAVLEAANLRAQLALRPQPSGETREIVEALEFYASAFDWHPGDGEAPDATHPGSPPTYYEASATDELIEDAGKRARTALALITPAPVASGGQHSSGEDINWKSEWEAVSSLRIKDRSAMAQAVSEIVLDLKVRGYVSHDGDPNWCKEATAWEKIVVRNLSAIPTQPESLSEEVDARRRLLQRIEQWDGETEYDAEDIASLADDILHEFNGAPVLSSSALGYVSADAEAALKAGINRVIYPAPSAHASFPLYASPVPAQDDDKLRIAVEALEYYAGPHALPNEGPWGASSDDYGRRAAETLRVLQSNANGWADVKCRQCGVAFGLHLPSCLRPSVSDEDQ